MASSELCSYRHVKTMQFLKVQSQMKMFPKPLSDITCRIFRATEKRKDNRLFQGGLQRLLLDLKFGVWVEDNLVKPKGNAHHT